MKPVLEQYVKSDPRIKVVYREKNGNISAASNTCLSLATGEYIALLDNDDEYAEHALFKVAEVIHRDPAVDMIYSDEDKLDLQGVHVDPFFKPDWSPEYFLACMYTCHLSAYRKTLIERVGAFRSEFDNAQDYDLALASWQRIPASFIIPMCSFHGACCQPPRPQTAAPNPMRMQRPRVLSNRI